MNNYPRYPLKYCRLKVQMLLNSYKKHFYYTCSHKMTNKPASKTKISNKSEMRIAKYAQMEAKCTFSTFQFTLYASISIHAGQFRTTARPPWRHLSDRRSVLRGGKNYFVMRSCDAADAHKLIYCRGQMVNFFAAMISHLPPTRLSKLFFRTSLILKASLFTFYVDYQYVLRISNRRQLLTRYYFVTRFYNINIINMY